MARRPLLSDEEILARARPLFLERGYAARTKQISAAVGLTWGAIALRFGDKRSLFTRAMAAAGHVYDEPACDQEGRADLPDFLERLRAQMWALWPLRLQYRLAITTAGPDSEAERFVQGLAAALETHALRGSIRSDMSAEALARVVITLLTGDVAQRFVARERALNADPAFIERVVRLLTSS